MWARIQGYKCGSWFRASNVYPPNLPVSMLSQSRTLTADSRGAQPIAKYACLAASSLASCLLAPEPVPFSMLLTEKEGQWARSENRRTIFGMLTDTLHSPLPSMRRTGELRRVFYEHSPLIRSLVEERQESGVRLRRGQRVGQRERRRSARRRRRRRGHSRRLRSRSVRRAK